MAAAHPCHPEPHSLCCRWMHTMIQDLSYQLGPHCICGQHKATACSFKVTTALHQMRMRFFLYANLAYAVYGLSPGSWSKLNPITGSLHVACMASTCDYMTSCSFVSNAMVVTWTAGSPGVVLTEFSTCKTIGLSSPRRRAPCSLSYRPAFFNHCSNGCFVTVSSSIEAWSTFENALEVLSRGVFYS